MPTARHCQGLKSSGKDDPCDILPTLLQSRPKVRVHQNTTPGSQPGTGAVDTPNDELCDHGLFHQDHGQLLWRQSTPPKHPPLGLPPADPALSYATKASSSGCEVPPLRYLPPELPPIDEMSMDTLPAPTPKNLLATAGVGRGGGRGLRQPRTPAPGLHQQWPMAPQQQMPMAAGISTSTHN